MRGFDLNASTNLGYVLMGGAPPVTKKARFLPKRRVRKYNKFFSYKNENREGRNFRYKNFGRSNSYNTRFTRSDFTFVNFEKAIMKYCGFNGATFHGAEFKNTNLKGSRFKGSSFRDTIFYHTNLAKTDFSGAVFENVVFIGTNVRNIQGISQTASGISVHSSIPAVQLTDNLRAALFGTKRNAYIVRSGVLCLDRGDQLFLVNIKRLLDRFTEDELTTGLKLATQQIRTNFYTLSYLIAFFDRAGSQGWSTGDTSASSLSPP